MSKLPNHKTRTKFAREEDPSLDRYLKEIGETDLIDRDEEVRLARKIKTGDKKALEKLTKANLRFVVSVAKQYQNQGLPLADLISEGNIGLIKAARRFDETLGYKFISYAVWWIRQAILQALAEQSRIVRLPLNRVGTLHKISKASTRLQQNLGRVPSSDELAQELDMNPDDVEETRRIQNSHLSLDAPFSVSEENSLIDVLEDAHALPADEAMNLEDLRGLLDKVLESLTPREAEVINLYFGLTGEKSLTLEEIGAHFSLTRERVRQIKEKAIRRLKFAARRHGLADYLDRSFRTRTF